MGACCATTQGIKDKKKNGKLEMANQEVPKLPSTELNQPAPSTSLTSLVPEPNPNKSILVEESIEPEIVEEV
jgi:hypothetical protein